MCNIRICHYYCFNAKTHFLSQVSSKLVIYLSCNVTLALEDIGQVLQHISWRITGLLDAGKGIRETVRQLHFYPATVRRWRDKFCATGEVKDRLCAERPRVTSARQAGICTGF